MPKGDNPNSRKNLKKPTTEEARERGSKGGKASVESRQMRASLNEALREAVTPEVAKQITETIVRKARAGNLKAYELIRDGLGEKPTEKVEQISSIVVDLGAMDGDSD